MAKQTLRAFQRQLRQIEPALEQAFLEAVQDIRSSAQLTAIEAAIARGDVEGVFQALRLGPEFFAPLDRQMDLAFQQGAIWQLGEMLPKKPGPEGRQLIVRFDQRNPRAEIWARGHAARRIAKITDDQRTLVRQAVTTGILEGEGADRIARRLVGVRRGNQRRGGLIGLHSREAEAVGRARAELSDPASWSDYLRRKARNRTFDRLIVRARREGRGLTAAEIDAAARAYSDRLLVKRGQRIARTEAHNAFSAGRNEGTLQLVESGQVPPSAVTLTWQATPSTRTRDTHAAMDGQEVKYGEAFTSPSGARMMFPGDPSLGAGAEETVNCRCGVRAEIDFVALAR